jgi:large subunit ribosomal protein LP0
MPPKAAAPAAEKKDEKKDEKKADAKGGKAPAKGGKGKAVKKEEVKDEPLTKDSFKKSSGEIEDEVAELTAGQKRRLRKGRYVAKLRKLVREFKNVLIATIDFVGSNQMQKIRIAIRGKGTVLIGKNTVTRKILREEAVKNPKLNNLIPLVQGNMGFIFTNSSLSDLRKLIQANKVPAPARVGGFAPEDVYVNPGPTGLDPGQTAFFQALNIPTKIVKGSIEIITKVHLIKKGEKVTASHVGLLAKLDVKPFAYGMIVTHAYENGSSYAASILDISQDDLLTAWLRGVRNVAALSIGVGIPTAASVAHSIVWGFKKLLAISMEVDYEFAESKAFKERAAAGPSKSAGPAAAEEEEAEEEEEEEEEEDEGVGASGLFGGDD